MANCPNCGSEHIQLKKEANVSWGRAVAGWALFGVVGGAVGAVTGEERNVNACLDCGTSWKAADVYEVLQVIQKFTGIKLDLSKEADRVFMNAFISELSSELNFDLHTISNIEQDGQRSIQRITQKLRNDSIKNFSIGCLGSFILYTILYAIASSISAAAASFVALSYFVIIFLFIVKILITKIFIADKIDKVGEKSRQLQIEKIQRDIEGQKFDAEANLKAKVERFVQKYPL